MRFGIAIPWTSVVAYLLFFAILLTGVGAGTGLVLSVHCYWQPTFKRNFELPQPATHVVALSSEKRIDQPFYCAIDNLAELRLTAATWATTPSDVAIRWQLLDATDGESRVLDQGEVSPAAVTDWSDLRIPLSRPIRSAGKNLTLSLTAAGIPQNPLGIALYSPTAPEIATAAIHGKEPLDSRVPGCLNLTLVFAVCTGQ